MGNNEPHVPAAQTAAAQPAAASLTNSTVSAALGPVPSASGVSVPAAPPAAAVLLAPPKPTQDEEAWLEANRKNEQEGIDQFDKTILTLTGGGFTVSILFIKEIVGPTDVAWIGLLVCAWIFWLLAMLCTLASFYASHKAAREAQSLFREGLRGKDITKASIWNTVTLALNPLAGISFLLGLVFILPFVILNLNNRNHAKPATTTNTAITSNATATATPEYAAPIAGAVTTGTITGTHSQPPAATPASISRTTNSASPWAEMKTTH